MIPAKSLTACQYCHRDTDQFCSQCSTRVCPQHSWTNVQRFKIITSVVGYFDEYRGVTDITMPQRWSARELCRGCHDAVLASKEAA